MKNKLLSALLVASMALSLTACGGNNNNSDSTSQTTTKATTAKPERPEDYDGNWYDVNELYQAILAEQPEDMEPLDMTDESDNKKLIKKNYPNFYNCDYEQILYYAPQAQDDDCEIMIVQTTTEREADYIEEEFLERIEKGASADTDPENIDSWVLRAEIQRDGNFVVMIVLPEGYEIPYIFGLL